MGRVRATLNIWVELLELGPPFDPSATCITRHEVFVLEDQLLFLFETDGGLESDETFVDAWRWASAWRDLVIEIRDADLVYSWTRPASAERADARLGLGL